MEHMNKKSRLLSVVVCSILQRAMLVHSPSVLTLPRPLLPTERDILHLWGDKERRPQYEVQNEHTQYIGPVRVKDM